MSEHTVGEPLFHRGQRQDDGYATAAEHPNSQPMAIGHHETADNYAGVIARLCLKHRVIICRDGIQWIAQYKKNGGAERPWRSAGYFRTRDALIRVCASLCGRIDPNAMAILAALPDVIGRAP
jgi:hypothetical protein